MKRRFFAQLRETARMIKISHSVFALPFALASAALAMRGHGGWSWETIFWIVLCAVFARTAAMAQNRLVDARLDAENPRTASRAPRYPSADRPSIRCTRRLAWGTERPVSASNIVTCRTVGSPR